MYTKLSEFLYRLSKVLRQKSLYFELKHHIKNGSTYLRQIHQLERGIGKTTTLIQLAHKYNAPIAVPNSEYARNVKKTANDMGKDITLVVASLNNTRGRRFGLVLCEEGLSPEMRDEINVCANCVVGFK